MLLDADPQGAFIPGPRLTIGPLATGLLSGRTCAVHDGIDCAGHVSGGGNPDWTTTRPVSSSTAPAVLVALQAGAACVGIARGQELSIGLTGENPWYGTPVNPPCPERLPGGACSGAAAVVAAGLADFALATDTAGSIRIPASYCGVFGFRPTFGLVTTSGVHAPAPSFTTVGWIASAASLLAGIGEVLLPFGRQGADGPLLRPEEPWVNAQPAVAEALRPALQRLERLRGRAIGVNLTPEGLDSVFDHFRVSYGEEVWTTLGSWVQGAEPPMGADLARQVEAARAIDPELAAPARAFRRAFQGRVKPLLAGGAVLVLPTSPCPAPRTDASYETLEAVYQATLGVTAIAELCGLPEVTLPVGRVHGAPVGLSLIGGAGHDRALLALACDAASVFGLAV
jgi:amidase